MERSYKIKSPSRASLNAVESEFAKMARVDNYKTRFGITDNDEIACVYFQAPPSDSVVNKMQELRQLVTVGVDPVLWNENPMSIYKEGCLDFLIESISQFPLILFLVKRVPITNQNLSTLTKTRSLKYLRLVENVSDAHVDQLCEFNFLESITLSNCSALSLEFFLRLFKKTRIPEAYVAPNSFADGQIQFLRARLPGTTIKVIGNDE